MELPELLPIPLEPAPPPHPLDDEPDDGDVEEFEDEFFRPMASAGEVARAPTKRPATVLAISFLFMLYLLGIRVFVLKPLRAPRGQSSSAANGIAIQPYRST